MREQIDGLLATAGLEPEEPVRIRTRRSGSLAQVELTLAPVHCLSLAEFNERVGRIQRMVESQVPEAEVTIVVDAGGAKAVPDPARPTAEEAPRGARTLISDRGPRRSAAGAPGPP
jgi:hypothetical protein